MWIKSITIERSRISPGSHTMVVETKTATGQTYKATANFENNFFMFAEAVSGIMKYFGQAHGHIKVESDGTVVPIAKRADRVIPTKYLKNFRVVE